VSNPLLAGKRIAVVEDEIPIGAMLEIMLEELGCVHAGTARTLPEALSLADTLAAGAADAVLVDYKLKGEESSPAAEKLMNRGFIVIMTTGMDDADLPLALQSCIIVRKPFGLELLEKGLMEAFATSFSPKAPTLKAHNETRLTA